MAESRIPGFDTVTWSGLSLPAAAQRDVIRRVHADIAKMQTAPEFMTRMLDQGIDQSEFDTPEKHAAILKLEAVIWSKVIREAGVKAE